MRLPSFSKMVQIELNSENRELLIEYTHKIESWIDQETDRKDSALSYTHVLGPSVPAIEVLRKRHRRTVLIICQNTKVLNQGAREMLSALGKIRGDLRVKIDVDPQSML